MSCPSPILKVGKQSAYRFVRGFEWMRLINFRQFYGDQMIRFSRDGNQT